MTSSRPSRDPAMRRAVVQSLLEEPSRGDSPDPSGGEGVGRVFALFVSGTCMEPTLRDGQKLLVRRQGWALPGDIVAFRRTIGGGEFVVHRLVGARPSRRGWVWLTQADNWESADPAVSPHQLLGVALTPVAAMDRARALARLGPALIAELRRLTRRSPDPVSSSQPG